MSVLSPRPQEELELELLIREARARQRRRRLFGAATVASVAAAGLSLWAAMPGHGGGAHGSSGGSRLTAPRGISDTGRVQITKVGTSGGVTWAIDNRGMWLTTNGGRTWRLSAPARLLRQGLVDERVSQVEFVDPRHGWLYAGFINSASAPLARSALFRTSDGGRTWRRETPAGCCGNFDFLNARLGFFFGAKGNLYETRDGGAPWTPAGGRDYGGSPVFLDARHGVSWIDGGVLWTADGGKHWKDTRLGGKLPAAGNGLFAVPPVARVGRRLVLTAENGKVTPWFSDDGGRSWTPRPFPGWWTPYLAGGGPVGGGGSLFSAATANDWFAAARNELAVTTDAGRTWTLVHVAAVPKRWIIGSIDFTSATTGWAVFNGPAQSVLMRTTDGGHTWKPAGPRAPRHKTHA